MLVTKPVNWLSSALFQPDRLGNPITATIRNYDELIGEAGKTNRRLTVTVDGTDYAMDIYGETIGKLIDSFGNDSDKWVNRKIQILQVKNAKTGKDIKKINCIVN